MKLLHDCIVLVVESCFICNAFGFFSSKLSVVKIHVCDVLFEFTIVGLELIVVGLELIDAVQELLLLSVDKALATHHSSGATIDLRNHGRIRRRILRFYVHADIVIGLLVIGPLSLTGPVRHSRLNAWIESRIV
jgi:hypothetical protein